MLSAAIYFSGELILPAGMKLVERARAAGSDKRRCRSDSCVGIHLG